MSMKEEVQEHLQKDLVPFWQKLKDPEYGGFYGYMAEDGTVDREYEKGCILNSRILWFFSNAAMALKDQSLIKDAQCAYDFMKEKCLDKEYGGIFWSVTYDGKPLDTTKHIYNQAFAVYALSSYYKASGDKEAL